MNWIIFLNGNKPGQVKKNGAFLRISGFFVVNKNAIKSEKKAVIWVVWPIFQAFLITGWHFLPKPWRFFPFYYGLGIPASLEDV